MADEIDFDNIVKLRTNYVGFLLAISEQPHLMTTGWAQRIQAALDANDKLDADPVTFSDEEKEALRDRIAKSKLKFNKDYDDNRAAS